MSQSEKSKYYNALKAAGISFPRHYREYTTEQLKAAYEKLQAAQPAQPDPEPDPERTVDPEAAAFFGFDVQQEPQQQAAPPTPPAPPVTGPDPDELPGQRSFSKRLEEPIRVDEQGRIWLQEEILKPGYAKPRARRVLTYTDTGVEQKTVVNGEYVETFEVAGSGPPRTSQVKITLPSYQVGVYRDPRFPQFKVHTYNGRQGFDLFDVQRYYGGPELVPDTCKRIYVENVLCYDIRSVIRAIETEYRQRVLGLPAQ